MLPTILPPCKDRAQERAVVLAVPGDLAHCGKRSNAASRPRQLLVGPGPPTPNSDAAASCP